ncbi:DNA phosphorothioation-dependent restriction protein DptG [Halobacillus faecis]
MNNRLHIEKLDEIVAPKRHTKGKIDDVLPFSGNDSKNMIKGEFKSVVGEFSRKVSNQNLKDDSDPMMLKAKDQNPENSFVKKISNNVKSDSDQGNYDLERLFSSLLFNEQEDVKVIHPHIFKYYPLSSGKKKPLEKKVSKFLNEILSHNGVEDLSYAFEKSDDEDLLVSMILHNLDELDVQNESSSYKLLIPEISRLFREDLKFISSHKDFFLNNFQTLLQHYYFLYVSQITFKFEQVEKADYTKIDSLFYSLDWEALNKRRKAFDGMYNFKVLKERSSSTFVHVHTQAQLSHNWLNPNLKFLTYSELRTLLEDEASEEELRQYIEDLNLWLELYSEKLKITRPKPVSNLIEGFKTLYNLLKLGMSAEVCKNHGKLIEDAAYGKFLKTRGSLGHTLNITQDFLLLLTVLAVKDKKRIPLKNLFQEFRKRGVALDRYSQQEVTVLLDNLNIIEKKSDSGDAQYVKAIL